MKQEVFTIKLLAPKNHLHNSKTQKNLYKCLRGHTRTVYICYRYMEYYKTLQFVLSEHLFNDKIFRICEEDTDPILKQKTKQKGNAVHKTILSHFVED